jgi:hypothetical protein
MLKVVQQQVKLLRDGIMKSAAGTANSTDSSGWLHHFSVRDYHGMQNRETAQMNAEVCVYMKEAQICAYKIHLYFQRNGGEKTTVYKVAEKKVKTKIKKYFTSPNLVY